MSTLLALVLLAQATTFDIATFSAPAGWQRLDQNGMVQLQTTCTLGDRTITLTGDDDRADPKHGLVRLEQDSKDGATWDRLCILLAGIGDVCYARDEAP
jgi:hypothetical protein